MKKNHFIFLLLLFAYILSACVKQNATQQSTHMGEYPSYDAPMPKFSTPVTIEEVRSAFYRYSVVAIVKALHENNATNWNFVLDNIQSGDNEWIFYGKTCIAPGTDAHATEEFIAALALGLPQNPEAVLGLESSGLGISVRNICTTPFYAPTYEFLKNYGEKTLAALQNVEKPHLSEAKNICIHHLQLVLLNSEQAYKEGRWSPE